MNEINYPNRSEEKKKNMVKAPRLTPRLTPASRKDGCPCGQRVSRLVRPRRYCHLSGARKPPPQVTRGRRLRLAAPGTRRRGPPRRPGRCLGARAGLLGGRAWTRGFPRGRHRHWCQAGRGWKARRGPRGPGGRRRRLGDPGGRGRPGASRLRAVAHGSTSGFSASLAVCYLSLRVAFLCRWYLIRKDILKTSEKPRATTRGVISCERILRPGCSEDDREGLNPWRPGDVCPRGPPRRRKAGKNQRSPQEDTWTCGDPATRLASCRGL